MRRRALVVSVAGATLFVGLVAGCGTSAGGSSSQAGSSPSAAATESNPPGDIPDDQAFVAYRAPAGGFTVKVPEGWGRKASGSTVAFDGKLNHIEISWKRASAAPTAASVNSQVIPALRHKVAKFSKGKVTTVSRKGGQAVLLTYQGDTVPDTVTGKVVRNAFERYAFHQKGHEVDVTLSGPVKADNVDPWRTVSNSFRWQS